MLWHSAILGFYLGVGLVHVPAIPHLIQPPVNILGKAVENGASTWGPATYMKDLEEAPGCWLPPG